MFYYTRDILKLVKDQINKVLDELKEGSAEFSNIDADKVKEMFLGLGNCDDEDVEIAIDTKFFNEIFEEELIAFTKRNGGIITHLDCCEIIMRILFNEAKMVVKKVNVVNEGPIEVVINNKESIYVEITNKKAIPIIGDVTTRKLY